MPGIAYIYSEINPWIWQPDTEMLCYIASTPDFQATSTPCFQALVPAQEPGNEATHNGDHVSLGI